jgi:hypothetical protein
MPQYIEGSPSKFKLIMPGRQGTATVKSSIISNPMNWISDLSSAQAGVEVSMITSWNSNTFYLLALSGKGKLEILKFHGLPPSYYGGTLLASNRLALFNRLGLRILTPKTVRTMTLTPD